MAIGSTNYPQPVQVNGFLCRSCTDVDNAKKHIDPAHPKSGPYGINAESDPSNPQVSSSSAAAYPAPKSQLEDRGGPPASSSIYRHNLRVPEIYAPPAAARYSAWTARSHVPSPRNKLEQPAGKMDKHIEPVEPAKAYRLINHGPTVLVSARYDSITDVMAAAWACALDFNPPKLTVVLDKITRTRELIEGAGRFIVQVPTVAQLELTTALGSFSLRDQPDKLDRAGAELFAIDATTSLSLPDAQHGWPAA